MGNIFVTASPSGGGKTTINRQLLKMLPNLKLSISYTTRSPRPRDKEGVDYYFIDEKEFKDKIKNNDFVEYAKVHGCYYGTSASKMNELLAKSYDVLLEIDVQGAAQIKKQFSNACLIFILPPTMQVMIDRLKARQTENDTQLKVRLDTAKKELEEIHNYDYIVVNDDLETAVNDMMRIIETVGLKVENNKDFIDRFFNNKND